MKKLLLSLMVLATLASCGKDNKVDGGTATGTSTNAITISDQTGIALGSAIDNYTTAFGAGQVYYGPYLYTWNTLINSGLVLHYKFTRSTASNSGNGSSCSVKWGWFTYCTYSNVYSSAGTLTLSRETLSNVDIGTKINELKSIINRQNTLLPITVNGTAYLITATDGVQYVIDLKYPLTANPIGIKTATETEYLFTITDK